MHMPMTLMLIRTVKRWILPKITSVSNEPQITAPSTENAPKITGITDLNAISINTHIITSDSVPKILISL